MATGLQESELCRCGCRGHCTIFGAMAFLEWSLVAMASGTRPSTRWDGSAWPVDSKLGKLVSERQSMQNRFICIQLKSDWVEFSSTFSFAPFSTHNSPCTFCTTTRANLLDFTSVASAGHMRGGHAPNWYEDECRASEIHVTVSSEEDRQSIIAAGLTWSTGKKKSGHILLRDCPRFDLRKFDSLEPSLEMWDTNNFYSMPIPFTATFWRTRYDFKHRPLNRLKHRNVFFPSVLA